MAQHFTYITPHKGTSKSARPVKPYKAPPKTKIISEGSCITYGVCPNAEYGSPQVRSYPAYFDAMNFAKPYSWVANSAARSWQADGWVHANSTVKVENAIFTYMPEDDLYNMSGNIAFQDYLNDVGDYLDARRAVGFTVVLITTLPRIDTGWNEYWRHLQNNVFTSWVGSHCDSVCDFGGMPQMYNTSNTTLYLPWHLQANSTMSPGVFPTEVGHKLMADFLKDHLKNVHHINE